MTAALAAAAGLAGRRLVIFFARGLSATLVRAREVPVVGFVLAVRGWDVRFMSDVWRDFRCLSNGGALADTTARSVRPAVARRKVKMAAVDSTP